MAKKKKSAFNLDLGEVNGHVSFKDLDELDKWHQEQKAFFQWVGQTSSQNQNIRGIWGHLNQKWQQADKLINNVRQHVGTEREESQFTSLASQIQSLYSQNFLISSTASAKFVEELRETDPIVSAFALSYFLGLGVQSNDLKALEGAFVALQFSKGVNSNIAHEISSLQELKNKWEQELNSLRNEYIELNNQEEQLQEEHKNNINEQKESFEEVINEGKETLAEIAETYDQKMALQSSVDYWKTKKIDHDKLAKVFGFVSLGAGAAISLALGFTAYNLFEGIDKPEYWRIALLAILASFGIWVVRILVRIFLSNLHLSTDAEERVTMIKTYIAMLRDGQGPKDEDRQLVLQTMFRPSQIGLVKDEAAPPTVIDVVARMAGKK